MAMADWQSATLGTFAVQLASDLPGAGQPPDSRLLLCLINRDEIPVPFLLPAGVWQQRCDSSAPQPFAAGRRETTSLVAARSIQLLSRE